MTNSPAAEHAPLGLMPSRPENPISLSDIKGVVSYSFPWPDSSLINFLSLSTVSARVLWQTNTDSPSFAGTGATTIITADGADRFEHVRQQADQLFSKVTWTSNGAPSEAGPRLFGGFSYWPETASQGIWSAFPSAMFILPRYQLASFNGNHWLTINHPFAAAEDAAQSAIIAAEESRSLQAAALNYQLPASPPAHFEIEDLMSQPHWEQMLGDIIQSIRNGQLEKAVLARARRLKSSHTIDALPVLRRLAAAYPDCYRFLIEPLPGQTFFGATPELLAQVNESALTTVSLAGSIGRGTTSQEDAALAESLFASPKERHEHALVVRAVRECLQPIVTELRVPPQPSLFRLHNIQHLRSDFQAQLTPGSDILQVIEALHPTPAVGGTPRRVALPMLAKLEPVSRGWYASPVGWLDSNGNGIFAVSIRSAISVGDEARLYAGAGIVEDSNPEREWQETQLKFKPLRDALLASNVHEQR